MCDLRNQQKETAIQIDGEQTDTDGPVILDPRYIFQNNNDSASESYESSDSEDNTETGNQQVETAVLMDAEPVVSDPRDLCDNYDNNDSASESYESSCSDDSTETVPSIAGFLNHEIDEFMAGVQRRGNNNILGRELPADIEESFRQEISAWNTFLQPEQGGWSASAVISTYIKRDTNKYIRLRGAQWTKADKKWIKRWLPRWNMFLQARAGEMLLTGLNLFFTIVGFIIYIVDLGSDIGTSMYYAKNGQWWRAMVTLAIIYGAVIIHTVIKWISGQIQFTGAAAWLRYVASSLVNWPDVKQYGGLCLIEWKRFKSPATTAQLVPEWYERRRNVALLKCTEGACEACPQAILQLCLLVPDLYGHWTWTDYLRIAGASVSLCTAGAALVNMEKYWKIMNYIHLPLSELVVLHVWAVPVTVSRLLSVTLLLSVHPYWALAGVALHLALYGVYYCRTWGGPRTLADVIDMCLTSLKFFMSPFVVIRSVTYRRVLHAIHLLVNTAVTVMWARSTLLVSAQPVLYTTILCFNAVMFAAGLVGWQLHEKHWPDSYFIEHSR